MSQATVRSAARGASRKPSSRMNRRFVTIVHSQPKRNRLPAAVVAFIVALILLILLPLLINAQLGVLSYQIHDYQVSIAQYKEDNQQLQIQLNHKRSAESLRESAENEGLVPAGETGYITLETGTITGGGAAIAPEVPKEESEGEAALEEQSESNEEPDATQ